MPRTYELTPALVASNVGPGVLCLAAAGLGRSYRLHARRPGPELNRRVQRASLTPLADLPSGASRTVAPVESSPALVQVWIVGPLEQRAGYHDPCGGYTDGHDAIADRLCAAFEEGDVLLVVDSPGGAAAGLQQGVERALKAKAHHGRRVTVFADEMIGSAAMWWAAAVGDEIYLPVAGRIGSIGARGEHVDVSAMLAREGIKKTYFADPVDKVAFAAEFPLSPVGEARGNRDVKLAADAFRAAVCGGPLGVRNALTPEELVELGADMLTGQAAVDTGLADGVASLEDVTAYALRMSETKETSTSARAARTGAPKARGGSMPGMRTEDDKKPKDEPGPGTEPDGSCKSCGSQNETNAKFCDQCGGSMAATRVEDDGEKEPEAEGDEPEKDAEGDEPPPSSKPIAPPHGAAAAARMKSNSALTEILGVASDASLPRQKMAALDLRQVFEHAAKLTGQKTADAICGTLTALSADARDAGRLRREVKAEQLKQERAQRWALAKRLVACGVPGHERGLVFVDAVGEDGKRKLDADQKPLMRLAPVYAEMKIGTLRGLVEGHERNAPARSPFEPDAAASREASREALTANDGAAFKQRVEAAKKSPSVLRLFNNPGNTHSLDAIAEQWVKTNDAAMAQTRGAL